MATEPNLIEQRTVLLREIAAVEKAAPPIAVVVADAVRELEIATERYRASPFSQPLGAMDDPLSQRLRELGRLGFLDPERAKQLVIEEVQRRTERSTVLRMAEPEKIARLDQLRGQLRQLEARIEQGRREADRRDPDNMQDRMGYNPDVYLRIDSELAMLARGKEV